ncbi:hypothetical protein SDC9_164012 [bioreactor metagenome]|uniref:Uncharacterized protein n=1 Tax=bioreactor metagenome TaxID=1076179 RepID=A0A645FQG1_9ZZZZ
MNVDRCPVCFLQRAHAADMVKMPVRQQNRDATKPVLLQRVQRGLCLAGVDDHNVLCAVCTENVDMFAQRAAGDLPKIHGTFTPKTRNRSQHS